MSANSKGDGIVNCNTNNTNNTTNQNVRVNHQISPVGPRGMPINQFNDVFTHQCCVDSSVKYYKVDFTNWQFMNEITGETVHIVFIADLAIQGRNSKFYYFHNLGCNRVFISLCDQVPQGLLNINYSCWGL